MTDQRDASPVLIRTVRPGDDLDAQLDLAERSFGPTSPAERHSRRQRLADRVAHGRTLGAFDGDRPAAAATFHDMRQWWCGRAVPMAGVGGVMVAPEDRGRRAADPGRARPGRAVRRDRLHDRRLLNHFRPTRRPPVRDGGAAGR